MHFRAFVPEQVAFKLSGGIDRDESGCSLKKREKKRQSWAAELFKYSGRRGNSGVALGCALRRELKSGSLLHRKGSNRARIESSSTQIGVKEVARVASGSLPRPLWAHLSSYSRGGDILCANFLPVVQNP